MARLLEDEVTEVPTDNELFAAMMFFAALSYPESVKKRNRAIQAMLAWSGRRYRERLGTLDPETDAGRAIREMTVQQQSNTLRAMYRRLESRLAMADIAMWLLAGSRIKVGERRVPISNQRMIMSGLIAAGWSTDGASRHTATQEWISEAPTLNNLAALSTGFRKDRHWVPEVLHLALALLSVNRTRPRSVPALLCEPSWAIPAIERAESFWLYGIRSTACPRSLLAAGQRPKVRLILSPTVEISGPDK